MKGINLAENNGMWKGNKVKYGSLHDYIKYHKPKSKLCESCKERKSFDLSNISGKYLRKLSDWKWLCRRCHMVKDSRLERLIKYDNKNWARGERSGNWNGGISLNLSCVDCGKPIIYSSVRKTKRCIKCHAVFKTGKPRWKK